MPDFVLSSGKEITFDFTKITVRQWRGLFSTEQTLDEEDAIIASVAGLTVDELLSLPQLEYKRLCKAFLTRGRNPISDEADSKN